MVLTFNTTSQSPIDNLVIIDIDDVLNELGRELYSYLGQRLGYREGHTHDYDLNKRFLVEDGKQWHDYMNLFYWNRLPVFATNTRSLLLSLQERLRHLGNCHFCVCTARGNVAPHANLQRILKRFIYLDLPSNFSLAVTDYRESKIESVINHFGVRPSLIIEDSPTTLLEAKSKGIPIAVSRRAYNLHIGSSLEWSLEGGLVDVVL